MTSELTLKRIALVESTLTSCSSGLYERQEVINALMQSLDNFGSKLHRVFNFRPRLVVSSQDNKFESDLEYIALVRLSGEVQTLHCSIFSLAAQCYNLDCQVATTLYKRERRTIPFEDFKALFACFRHSNRLAKRFEINSKGAINTIDHTLKSIMDNVKYQRSDAVSSRKLLGMIRQYIVMVKHHFEFIIRNSNEVILILSHQICLKE